MYILVKKKIARKVKKNSNVISKVVDKPKVKTTISKVTDDKKQVSKTQLKKAEKIIEQHKKEKIEEQVEEKIEQNIKKAIDQAEKKAFKTIEDAITPDNAEAIASSTKLHHIHRKVKVGVDLRHMKGRFMYLTFSLLLLMLLYPFMQAWGQTGIILLTSLLSFIPLASVYAFSYTKKEFNHFLMLAIPYIISSWLLIFFQDTILMHVSSGLAIFFYFYTVYLLITYIMRAEHINADTLYGVVSIYLLIGVLWFNIYSLIHSISPISFENLHQASDLFYYSFVTLTTLGYGDITPVTSFSKTFAILEAVMGILYTAIVISRIVGIQISTYLRKNL